MRILRCPSINGSLPDTKDIARELFILESGRTILASMDGSIT
jgi:hypothetical protein